MSAEIMGNEVVWLVPFNFPQKLTFEVDYSIMLSFLELYTNLLKFVNFKFKSMRKSQMLVLRTVEGKSYSTARVRRSVEPLIVLRASTYRGTLHSPS